MINIQGLPKAKVLAALHNATSALGMGRLHDLGRDMTEAEAQAFIDRGTDDMGFDRDRTHDGNTLKFDYVRGRPIKANLAGDEFDERGFDRDAGQGRAERAIATLRLEEAAAGRL